MAETVAATPPPPAGFQMQGGLPPPPDGFEVQNAEAAPTVATGMLSSFEAGYQTSVTGLRARGRMPDIVLDPEHQPWYERAMASVGQIAGDMPVMIPAAMGGAPTGAAAGTALAPFLGPLAPAAPVIGATIGGGAAMFGVPAAIREKLIQDYTKGDVKSVADFLDRTKIVLATGGEQAAVGAATTLTGMGVARVIGSAVAPAVGTALTGKAAARLISGGSTAAEVGTMVVAPAALQGRLPEFQEFVDGAVVIGGMHATLKTTGMITAKLRTIYAKTGVEPDQVVREAQQDPALREELTTEGPATATAEQIVPTPEGEPARAEAAFSGGETPETGSAGESPGARNLGEGPVYEAVRQDLAATNRFGPEETDNYARMTQAFFETMAAKTGKPVEELFGRYRPGIEAEGSTAGAYDQGAARGNTEAPALTIEHPDIREVVGGMAEHEAGWEQIGGRHLGGPTGTPNFSTWIPRAEWWPGRPDKLNEGKVQEAVRKALAGEPLRKAEQRTVDYMVDVANQRLRASAEVGHDEFNAAAEAAHTAGLELTTSNVVDVDAVARAAAIDEDAVERAAMAHADDDTAFMAEIRRINESQSEQGAEPAGGSQAGEPGQAAGAGGATARSGEASPGPGTAGAGSGRYRQSDRVAPPFYSELARQVEASKQGSATAAQWKATIKAMKGVKADEIDAIGLNDWLDTQSGKVTKVEIQQFVADHGVKVEVKQLGGPDTWVVHHPEVGDEYFADEMEARAYAKEVGATEVFPADNGASSQLKFGQYQLPGGTNYRERLVMLPTKPTMSFEEYRDGYRERFPNSRADDSMIREYWQAGHGMPEPGRSASASDPAVFRGGHFDEPNVVAHERVNDREIPLEQIKDSHPELYARIKAEGRDTVKVRFTEEFQSDWAQKGRRQGFGPRQEKEWIVRLKDGGAVYRRVNTEAEAKQLAEGQPELEIVEGERTVPGVVPSAPFVTKTEAWTRLMLKQAIRDAVEGGYDMIAWTTGAQQIDRYNDSLRQNVDAVRWEGVPQYSKWTVRTEDGRTWGDFSTRDKAAEAAQHLRGKADVIPAGEPVNDSVSITAEKGGRDVFEGVAKEGKFVGGYAEGKTVEEVLGKTMADRIAAAENGRLEGEGLSIGGEGMKGYYDKILPSVTNDVLKKMGGGKVGQVRFPSDGAIPEGRSIREFVVEQMERRARGEDVDSSAQHGFEITPAVREKALAGQPLFQPGGDRGYFDPDRLAIGMLANADRSTFLHESGHFYLEVLSELAGQEDASPTIKADWQKTLDWFGLTDDEWRAMDVDQRREYHEAYAGSFERYLQDGRAPTPELRGVFERFRQWLIEVYKTLAGSGVKISDDTRAMFDRLLATDEQMKDGVPAPYAQEAVNQRTAAIVPGTKARDFATQPYADIPQAAGEPALPTHVNYNYIRTTGDVKMALARISELYEDEINKQRRGKVSWEQTSQEAASLIADNLGGVDSSLFMPRAPGTAAGAAEVLARKTMVEGASSDMVRQGQALRDKGADATDEDKMNFLVSVERVSMITSEFLGARAEVGRALNILKSTVDAAARAKQIQDVITQYGADPTRLAQMLDRVENTAGRIKFAREITNLSSGAKKLVEDVQGVLARGGTPDEIDQALEALQNRRQVRVKPDQAKVGVQDVRDAIAKARGNPEKLKEVMDQISTPDGAQKFAEDLLKPSWWDMVVEAFKASILSGPVTHMANIIGNGAFAAMRPLVDLTASMNPVGTVTAREALGRAVGQMEGVKAGLKVAGAMVADDWSAIAPGLEPVAAKLAEGGWISKAEDLQGDKAESARPAIPGKIGMVVRQPFLMLSAADAVFKTMNEVGELNAIGVRQAYAEGLDPRTREFREAVERTVQNPTEDQQAQATAAGLRFTFNRELGEFGKSATAFVRAGHLQLLVPFVRTPLNIAKELVRMSMFAPMMSEWREDFNAGGTRRDKAVAELVLGATVMGVVASYALDGRISGNGDPDPHKRLVDMAAGWAPYSIKVGNTWYGYSRIQPLGTMFGMAADMAEMWDHFTDEEADKLPKMAAAAFANAITNQTFLQGITNVVNAMSEPERFAPRLMQQLAGAVVPNIIAQPTSMADPYARQVDSMLDAIKYRLPYARETLFTKPDIYGEPKANVDRIGGVLPITRSEESTDKVKSEAMRLGISAAEAPKKTHIGRGTGKIGDVQLEPEERFTFGTVAGRFAHEVLTQIVNQENWDDLPPIIQKRIYAKVFTAAHKRGAAVAIPPDKRAGLVNEVAEKIRTELEPE